MCNFLNLNLPLKGLSIANLIALWCMATKVGDHHFWLIFLRLKATLRQRLLDRISSKIPPNDNWSQKTGFPTQITTSKPKTQIPITGNIFFKINQISLFIFCSLLQILWHVRLTITSVSVVKLPQYMIKYFKSTLLGKGWLKCLRE